MGLGPQVLLLSSPGELLSGLRRLRLRRVFLAVVRVVKVLEGMACRFKRVLLKVSKTSLCLCVALLPKPMVSCISCLVTLGIRH